MAGLPPKPPSRPPAATTRWHGVPGASHVAMMLPTARQARGRPASRATPPYVQIRPGGIRRTAFSTRAVNDVVATRAFPF